MCNLFLSHKHKTLSPGVSFLSTIPMCATRTPLIQICLSLRRYENLRLFLLNISSSHTNTNSVSQVSYFSTVLLYVAHTHSLSLDISCVPSYVSLAITLVVKYLSLADTKLRLPGSFLSDICLYVTHMHPLSISLTPTHITQPSDPLDSYL